MLKRLKQLFCKHRNKCVYIYNTFADWKCEKCGRRTKGFAPVGFTNEDIKNKVI